MHSRRLCSPCARRVWNFYDRCSCRSVFFCKKHRPAHLPHVAPFVRSRLVKLLLGYGGETMWPWVSSLTPGKCKGSRDRLEKTSVRRTVNTEASAPPLTCSERPGHFGPGLVERRHCGLQRRWQAWTGYLLPTKATARLTRSIPPSRTEKNSVSPPWGSCGIQREHH